MPSSVAIVDFEQVNVSWVYLEKDEISENSLKSTKSFSNCDAYKTTYFIYNEIIAKYFSRIYLQLFIHCRLVFILYRNHSEDLQ